MKIKLKEIKQNEIETGNKKEETWIIVDQMNGD